jgi:isoquinoline 1-oxidoreductase beta subunit
VGGAVHLPYAIPNVRVTYAKVPLPIPVGYWRSVAHSQNGFVTECFFDELAAAAKADPFELRQKLLSEQPRLRTVLERAAQAAGWGEPLGEGRARGIAAAEAYGSFVAQVAEVSIDAGQVRVHRVTCAVDCGRAINPLSVEAQMEGGIVVGLSAALYGRIDIAKGRAVQSNFHDYPVLDMAHCPRIETIVVPSQAAVGGVGEPAVPVIAPAVCNAVHALTGKPVRSLPIEVS